MAYQKELRAGAADRERFFVGSENEYRGGGSAGVASLAAGRLLSAVSRRMAATIANAGRARAHRPVRYGRT
jgi:hypothetical protein